MTRFRPTIRLRLTLLYGAMFLVAGVVLLTVNYTLVRQSLPEPAERERNPFLEGLFLLEAEESLTETDRFPIEIFETPDGRPLRQFFADFESDVQDNTLDELVTQSVVALTITGGAAVFLGWLVAGRTLRPVHQITATARSATQSNLQTRVGLDGPKDELKELADTFDDMLARLETAFESQRRFAANASHELRTPLSVIRAETDVALGEPDVTERERSLALRIREAADRSEALIDGLLTLARSESRVRDVSPVDLAALAGDVAGELVPLADEHGVKVHLQLDDATVNGDNVLLERLILNLATNAIVHNRPEPEGGRWMRLRVYEEEQNAVLIVANSGPRISGEEVEWIVEPFQRREGHNGSDRHGAGLGLAIVRAIARTHGGTLILRPRPAGGLDVMVTLPAAR